MKFSVMGPSIYSVSLEPFNVFSSFEHLWSASYLDDYKFFVILPFVSLYDSVFWLNHMILLLIVLFRACAMIYLL